MSVALEGRFERYCQSIVAALGHADRQQPAQWYLKGLILPGQRKSVEPMAARVHPQDARSAHQSMHHLVAMADWEDRAVLGTVAQQVTPKLVTGAEDCWWILDDTGHAKKGTKSVGVARQYCGRLGKTDSCQIAVSLSLASARGSIPVAYRLYLPQEWIDDRQRCRAAGVPDDIQFKTKRQIARDHIIAALAQGLPRGIVLGDAGYGDDTDFRDWLIAQELDYALAVKSGTTVWWGKHQPAKAPPPSNRGRPRTLLVRDTNHQPTSVAELARTLPPKSWQQISWREGTNGTLSWRFARVRVRAAHGNQARTEEWLLIEWPEAETEPSHYWLSTLPNKLAFKKLVRHAKARWMIERDYQELKSELGLSHYEGRNWRGFHHHATLCITAYGFLMLERLAFKKTPLNSKNLPYPEPSPRAAQGPMQRHVPWSISTLRERLANAIANLFAQTLTRYQRPPEKACESAHI